MAALPQIFSFATLNCRGSISLEKVSAVKQAVKDLEIICLQETHFKNDRDSDLFNRTLGQNFKIYNSYTQFGNTFTGVTFLIRRDCPITNIQKQLEIRGRALGLSLAIGNLTFFILGLYAPAQDIARRTFFTMLIETLGGIEWYNSQNVVLLGDFNLVESPTLDRYSTAATPDRQVGLKEFLLLKDFLAVHDAYRLKHPDQKDLFTYRSDQHGSLSRLDRVYVSLSLTEGVLSTTRSVLYSDHKLFRIKANLKLASCVRGPGYYKINTLLLAEPEANTYFIPRLQHILENLDNADDLWEFFKTEVKVYFSFLGKQRAKERNLKRKQLEQAIRCSERLIVELNDPHDQNILKSLLKRQKQELNGINNYYLASCRHSTYFKDYVDDKISFSTAKSLQRRDWENKHIFAIKTSTGTMATKPDEISNVIVNQYSDLFKSEGICLETLLHFLAVENFPKLSNDQRTVLEEPIGVDEVKHAIHALQGNKTPGYDGIPIEFYKQFSDLVARVLCNIFNAYIQKGQMYESAYDGVITLMYKGSGERTLRENWRPLTLLNVDYKIYAKVLAQRIEKVMTTLVHPDQSSSVPGRNIRDGIAHVMSVVHYADRRNADAMILSVDHQAAFDMVEWLFIFQVLEAMNFGPNYIRYVEVIYKYGKVKSAVNVNGFISGFFEISRGIRQGCPFSPYIYTITSETLAHYIRKSPLIRGIPMCGTNNRITKYADDTSLFLSKWSEIDTIFNIFNQYKEASGSRLKQAKTQLLLLGNFKHQVVPARFRDYVVPKLKLYGIYVNSTDLDNDDNWRKSEDSIMRLERRVPPYGMSVFSRIHFIQIYYLCMLNYVMSMITPPFNLINRTNKAIVRFLWFPSRANVIARDTLKLPACLGGIGFPDLDIRNKVNRLHFLIKVLSSKEELSWRRCFWHFYSRVDNKSKREINRIQDIPNFYKEIRFAVIESNFRRDGAFCWVFQTKIFMETVTTKWLYEKWILNAYQNKLDFKHIFWSNHLGIGASPAYIRKSWTWSKVKFLDGRARNVHFRLRHLSLYTNNRVAIFTQNVQPHCSFCFSQGNIVRENNFHVFMLCPRVLDIYHDIEPFLKRIAGLRYVDMQDLILGRKIGDKYKQTCFNFIVQHCQLAIWTHRYCTENNLVNLSVSDIFHKNLYQNLARVKTVVSDEIFFRYFHYIAGRNSSFFGFYLMI